MPVSPFFPSLSTPLGALDQESLLCHSLAASPWAGQLCVSRPQEFHLYNEEYDLCPTGMLTGPSGANTQCERGLSEVEPWPTQAITKMTNCFPRPGFSPLEARLRLPVPPPQARSSGRGDWEAELPSP